MSDDKMRMCEKPTEISFDQFRGYRFVWPVLQGNFRFTIDEITRVQTKKAVRQL
jgi:hypothetical protein